MILDTVHGANNAKIRQYGMGASPAYGVLSKTPSWKLRQIFNQLLAEGYLKTTPDSYMIVKLTEKSEALIAGQETFTMKMAKEPEKEAKTTAKKKVKKTAGLVLNKEQEKREMPEAEKKYYRNLAREVLGARTGYYARKMGVTYGRISIREQKTRWGSCSSVGNLNYNWKLVLMPPGVLDYVVVHELAHRREMNHSAAFWKVVATWMPDYKKYRKWLRDNGNQF